MSAFTALNVEPEENPEDDVDNTREIQLEEAFKLYQNALKLHAQGPKYYEQAAEAYDVLFKSDVFKYPESLTDFTQEIPDVELEPEFPPEEGFVPVSDDGPSTLPQVLHLAYKNHGQFIMDCLKHRVKTEQNISRSGMIPKAQAALEEFTQALARDESDTELWRRAARVGEILGSKSIARYCLEAAVEVDDDPTLGEVDPANLEEGFAGVQLKELLEVLSDDMALSHPIMLPYEKKQMSTRLEKYLDPYPFLKTIRLDDAAEESKLTQTSRTEGDVKSFTWHSVGEAIHRLYPCKDDGPETAGHAPGGEIITLNLPTQDVEMADAAVVTCQPTDESIAVTDKTTPSVDVPVEDQSTAQGAQDSGEPKVDEELCQATRKRSQSTAGLPETPDEETGAQKRSKRIRKRDTLNGDGALPADPEAENKYSYERMCGGDEYMFVYIQGLLEKFDVQELGSSAAVQAIVDSEKAQEYGNNLRDLAIRDIQAVVLKWDTHLSGIFNTANGLDILGSTGSLKKNGLTAFLDHSKTESLRAKTQAEITDTTGIAEFINSINENSLTIEEVGYRYFKATCQSYRHSLWPEPLKVVNMQLMDLMDPALQSQLEAEYDELQIQDSDSAKWDHLKEFVQMMLELHLDIYISITNPSSMANISSQLREKDRLDRWATLASDIMQAHPNDPESEIAVRYLWASVLFASTTEHISREHMVLCWTEVRQLLQTSHIPKIELYNNVAIAEVSASAADREISRLTTMDFFLNLFKEDLDPLTVIEALEPVIDDSVYVSTPDTDGENVEPVDAHILPPAVRDMRKFLENGSPSLRLYLWQRLREAYQEIEYPTKIFSCHLKCIGIIVDYLQSLKFAEIAEEARHKEFLGYLKVVDELLVKALTLALNNQTAFEIIDDAHLMSSMKAVASLCRMLYAGTLLEDQVAAGLIPDNTVIVGKGKDKSPTPVTSLKAFFTRLSEMSIRSWALLYTLVKEGMTQNKDRFDTMDNDLAEFLAIVHYSLGLRLRCERSNKIFVKMMKVELIRLKFVEKWEDYLGQVLWDLYGLRLGDKIGVFEIMDHGCEKEKLDRRTAVSIVDHVIVLAKRLNMKDLLRDELKFTIESMQQAMGAAKTNAQTSHNLRNITEYLKLSINPLRMNRALKGLEFIDTLPVVHTTESALAEKGWYFLLGMMNLSRFRTQKRTAAGSTDDLKVAASFFRLELQFTADNWEAWYRMAQCFDSELDEDVLWSADKLNGDRTSLISEQRSAIHCYTMAISTAMRNADASFETAEKMSDMYHDFGYRIYASSRDPFHMEPFYMDDFERHMSGYNGMYKKSAHEELSRYKAWRFAAGLFKRALAEKPNYWMSHYMLAKCYWKMFTRFEDEPDLRAREARPSLPSLLHALERAVETCPKPRDSRTEPILEPHYKIVSIMHKLVQFRFIDRQKAADILQRQRYPIRKGEAVVITDDDSWEKFIFEHVRHLRSLDKSNWQHRFISRSAHLVFDNKPEDYAVAQAAQIQMAIFTKTMVVNAWKTELERAGRHCVYMSKYVKFMVHILYLTHDKTSMEALAKRVRKKPTEYYHFNEVWTDCCTMYCKLIRRSGHIELNQDELIKSIPPEDFEDMAAALERWVDDPANSHPVYDHLKEALELKKLNANLMKAMPIDDLISDAYATLMLDVGCHLPRPPRQVIAAPPPDAPPPRQGPMSMSSLVSNLEGASESVQVTVEEVVNVKPKAKAPGRREILRRAEVLVNRVHEEKEKDKEKEKTGEKSESRRASDLQVLIRRASKDAGGKREKDGGSAQGQGEESHDGDEHDEGGDRESTPGSVHDSADDESDLSDVPDMEEGPPTLFNRWNSASQVRSADAASGDN